MIRKIAVIFLLTILVMTGCAVQTQTVTPAGQAVKVTKAEPPPGCTEIGPIEAKSGGGCGMYGAKGTYEDSYNILRNKAAGMGANHVRMDSQIPPHNAGGCFDQAFVIRGIAYYCP
jgi:phosphate-selective porin